MPKLYRNKIINGTSGGATTTLDLPPIQDFDYLKYTCLSIENNTGVNITFKLSVVINGNEYPFYTSGNIANGSIGQYINHEPVIGKDDFIRILVTGGNANTTFTIYTEGLIYNQKELF